MSEKNINKGIVNFVDEEHGDSIIKVVGVGGGGGNAVNHMFKEGIHKVSFVLCNTDKQALDDSPVPVHLQLGKEGLGAGNRPLKAKAAAEESIDDIKEMFSDGTKMAFITAGMGGGTGTGAAPVIARISKEMGMNHFGELAVLTQIAKPDAALVNNALRAHVGCGFDGTNDIAKAKSEIYQGLGEDGLALIPCEDEHATVFQTSSQGHQQRTFGVDSGDVHAENIVLKPLSCEFDLVCGNERAAVVLPVPGRHNVHNAAAAAALALAAGLSLDDVAEGLKGFSNIKGRLNVKSGIKGATLIDDTYNANPDSMKAAIDVLARMPAPRIFVMGDMGELGEDEAAAMHAEVGAYARDQGIEAAYFVGDNSVEAAETFGADGLWFAAKDPLIQVLSHDLPERATVLVKGSRFMKMEEVVEALTDKEVV